MCREHTFRHPTTFEVALVESFIILRQLRPLIAAKLESINLNYTFTMAQKVVTKSTEVEMKDTPAEEKPKEKELTPEQKEKAALALLYAGMIFIFNFVFFCKLQSANPF